VSHGGGGALEGPRGDGGVATAAVAVAYPAASAASASAASTPASFIASTPTAAGNANASAAAVVQVPAAGVMERRLVVVAVVGEGARELAVLHHGAGRRGRSRGLRRAAPGPCTATAAATTAAANTTSASATAAADKDATEANGAAAAATAASTVVAATTATAVVLSAAVTQREAERRQLLERDAPEPGHHLQRRALGVSVPRRLVRLVLPRQGDEILHVHDRAGGCHLGQRGRNKSRRRGDWRRRRAETGAVTTERGGSKIAFTTPSVAPADASAAAATTASRRRPVRRFGSDGMRTRRLAFQLRQAGAQRGDLVDPLRHRRRRRKARARGGDLINPF
jgi:hypothetical protein